MNKHFPLLVAETIILAAIVGAIPDLLISGADDLFGPCPYDAICSAQTFDGFSDKICDQVAFTGLIKLAAAGVCTFLSFFVVYSIFTNFSREK